MHVACPEDTLLLQETVPTIGTVLTIDQCFALAYRLALEGLGRVSPNPLVGCVITDDHYRLLGMGRHRGYGQQHAEVDAVRQVENFSADRLRNSKFFITLQPCSHQGKTPPCTELIIKCRAAEVYYAQRDPNPLVADSEKILCEAGLVCRHYNYPEINWLDEVYFWHQQHPKIARPFVAAKIASTLDGRFASDNSNRLTITNQRAQRYGHLLRWRYDAIMIGKNTLLLDNPTLNVRLTGLTTRNPWKIVFADTDVLQNNKLNIIKHQPEKTIIVITEQEYKKNTHQPSGVHIVTIPNKQALRYLLRDVLYRQFKINSILLEGGGKLWSAFFAEKLIDKLHLFQTPKILGKNYRRWFDGLSIDELQLTNTRLLPLDGNWQLEGIMSGTESLGAVDVFSNTNFAL